MSQKQVTVIISPRDRYSGLADCIENLYAHTDENDFDLVILDLGYPKAEIVQAALKIAKRSNAKIVSYGLMIPMEGLRNIQPDITTPYTFLLDNDSRVSKGWLIPLLETAKSTKAAVVSPLILETAGVDGDYTRNHVYRVEIRVVDVENTPYLIEHKTHRRALLENIPKETALTQAFELHGVLFRTDAFQTIELPQMSIREHLDIGMQLKVKGELLYAEPRSIIYFDNLGTRAQLKDLQFFNYRWNYKIGKYSHDLFERRWGYKWYAEQSVYFWCMRRRIYMLLRWLHIPIAIAGIIDRVVSGIKRRLFPIWDPLKNPIESSSLLYDETTTNTPVQVSHDIKL